MISGKKKHPQLYFSLPGRAKNTYIHVGALLTVAIMKMHLFFFWVLFSFAVAAPPGKKKTRRTTTKKNAFVSGIAESPSLPQLGKAQKPRAVTNPTSQVAVLLLSQF